MKGMVTYNFLAVLKWQKILGDICFSEQIFYRKQSLGAHVYFLTDDAQASFCSRQSNVDLVFVSHKS